MRAPIMIMRAAAGLLGAFAVVLALAGCGDLLQEPDTGTRPAGMRLVAVSGNGQTGEVGAALEEPLRVRVLDGADRPIAGLWVVWTAPRGSGTAEPRNTFSDADGIAETTWILGSSAGEQTIVASVKRGDHALFEAMAEAR